MPAAPSVPSAATSQPATATPGRTAFDPTASPRDEVRRQLDHLIALGYPDLLGVMSESLRLVVELLADVPEKLPVSSKVPPEDHVPFVVVISAGLPLEDAAGLMRLKRKPATFMITSEELLEYRPIAGVEVPDAVAYLLTDIDTGSEFCNVKPEDALRVITGRGRTPLTIAEGIALVTQRPDTLRKNKCFS